jgi:DNA-binding transcriptional ArsR family regulator
MSRHIDHSNPKRLRILAMLRETPDITQAEIIRRTGLSQTTARWHIMNIKKDGLIELQERQGRPRKVKPAQKVSSEKLSEYGRLGRGRNAFVPRSPDQWVAGDRKRKHDKLQERIDKVVKKALQKQGSTQHDVIRHVNTPLRVRNAHKVG